jgi:hypothetical protein
VIIEEPIQPPAPEPEPAQAAPSAPAPAPEPVRHPEPSPEPLSPRTALNMSIRHMLEADRLRTQARRAHLLTAYTRGLRSL